MGCGSVCHNRRRSWILGRSLQRSRRIWRVRLLRLPGRVCCSCLERALYDMFLAGCRVRPDSRRSGLHRPAGRCQQQRHRQLHGYSEQPAQQPDSCYPGAFRCAQPAEDCGSGCLDRGSAYAECCRSQCCGYQRTACQHQRQDKLDRH